MVIVAIRSKNYGDKEKTWPQIYSILVVCLNSMLGGLLFAWPSPSMVALLSEWNPIPMTQTQVSYFTVIPPVALLVVSPLVGSLIDRWGRKRALLSATIPYAISLLLAAVGGPLYIYYLARIADGIGDACMYSSMTSYVSEIATPRVRGSWGNTISLSMYFGQLVMNTIGSYFTVPVAAYIGLVLPTVFLLNYALLPESPYWLLIQGRTEEARQTLQWLRRVRNVEVELDQLIADVARQQSETGRYVDIWLIKNNRRSAIIVMLLRWMQNLGGSAPFAVNIQTIFLRSGMSLAASTSAMIYNGTCLTCSIIASIFLDRLGRRLAMILSCAGCGLALIAQTAVFYINDETDLKVEVFEVMPLILMMFYVISFSLGLGIVPTLLQGELFSTSIKSKAFVVLNMNVGVAVASASFIFAMLLDNVGLYAIFGFYAICTVIATLICFYIIPETRGRTLEQIQQDLKK